MLGRSQIWQKKEREPRAKIQRDFTKEADAQRSELLKIAASQGMTPSNKAVVGSGIRIHGATGTETARIDMPTEEFLDRFEPEFDWCLIRMTPREETRPSLYAKSGLIETIEVSQQARNKDGIVLKIGSHEFDADYNKAVKPGFKLGDRVWYGAWAGQETPCPWGYLMVRSKDIKLKVDQDAKLEWH